MLSDSPIPEEVSDRVTEAHLFSYFVVPMGISMKGSGQVCYETQSWVGGRAQRGVELVSRSSSGLILVVKVMISREGDMIRSFNNHTPKIEPTAFICEQAYVVGRVHIGEGSSVWPSAVVRGDTAAILIGRYVNIQDNSLVHADNDATYGDYITIGHGVVCHARRVSSHVLIGNGAVVNDGVEIGEFSVIASGAVVLEDVKIPSYSLVVGVPAVVKAQVQQRHVELIKRMAKEYGEKARLYLESGLGDNIANL